MSGPAGPVPTDNSKRGQEDPGPGAESSAGWAIFGYLLSGMAVYGGIGWLIGRWAGNQSLCLAVGMLIGLALALTLVIRRYGRS
jgi:ATP synthase protein I